MQTDRYHNFKLFKLIQLILLILFGLMFFCYLSLDPLLRNNIYSNRNLLTICVFLWAFMLYSAVCLIGDFYQLQKAIIESHKLSQAAYIDSLTGLPNRNGCDVVIEKYSLKHDIGSMGCALIELSSIDRINLEKGRSRGDKYIHDFATVFEPIAVKFGFAGRNSGNEFLLIVDDCPQDKMEGFISQLNAAIDKYNEEKSDLPIEIKLGFILNANEGLNDFSALISKLYSENRRG